MVKMYIFFILIIYFNTIFASNDQNSCQQIHNRKTGTVIERTRVSQEEYEKAYNDYKNSLELEKTQNNVSYSYSNSQQSTDFTRWKLESSMNNAPTLLKGICSYLKERLNRHAHIYTTEIVSYHRFILVGPPGCGKTTLAHAIGHMLNYSVVFIPASSLFGRYRNEAATKIANILKEHNHTSPNTIIIIDELHKLFEHHSNDHSDDSQSAAAFWLMLDELEKHHPNIIVIGTANGVNTLPPEIKSRFSGKIISIDMPSKNQKIQAFKDIINNDNSIQLDSAINDKVITAIIDRIPNGSLRDICLIIDAAKVFYYAERSINKTDSPIVLTKKHFQQALKQLSIESTLLQEKTTDKLYKQVQQYGMILSMTVNITTLVSVSHKFWTWANTAKN